MSKEPVRYHAFLWVAIHLYLSIILPAKAEASKTLWASGTDPAGSIFNIFVDSESKIKYLAPLFDPQLPALDGIAVYDSHNALVRDTKKVYDLAILAQNLAWLRFCSIINGDPNHSRQRWNACLPHSWIKKLETTEFSFYIPSQIRQITVDTLIRPQLSIFNQRKWYYKEALFETILQTEVATAMGDDLAYPVSALKDQADKLSGILKGIMVAQDIAEIQLLLKIMNGELEDLNPADFGEAIETLNKYIKDKKIFDKLNKLKDTLTALNFVTQMAGNVAQYLFLQSCVVEPVVEKRIEAIGALLDYSRDEGQLDEALSEAYSEVAEDFQAAVSARNLAYSFASAEDFKDYAKLVFTVAAKMAGIHSGLIITPYLLSAELVFGVIDDNDLLLRASALATLQRLTSSYLVKLDADVSASDEVDVQSLEMFLNLANIDLGLQYAFSSIIYRTIAAQLEAGDAYEWLKWMVYSLSYASQYTVAQDVLQANLKNILNDQVFCVLLHPPYFFGDLETWPHECTQFGTSHLMADLVSKSLDNLVNLQLKIDKTEYYKDDLVTVSVLTVNQLGEFSQADEVKYEIRNENSLVVMQGEMEATDTPGRYEHAFQAGVLSELGYYTLRISATKNGLASRPVETLFALKLAPQEGHDLCITGVSWGSGSSFNPEEGRIHIEKGDTIHADAIYVKNLGYYPESDVPLVIEIVDHDTQESKARSTALLDSSIEPSKSQLIEVHLAINTGSVPDLADGIYKVVVATNLATDSDRRNDCFSWDIIVGTPPKPPEHIDPGSYNFYVVKQEGSSDSLTSTIVNGADQKTVSIRYVSGNSVSLTTSCDSHGHQIDKQRFYSVCSGNVFVSLQGCSEYYVSGETRYFLELEVGIKIPESSDQVNRYYQVARRWGGQCGLKYISDPLAVARFHGYSQTGLHSSLLIGYNPFLGSLMDSYINTWSYPSVPM